jgi:hypothetical protein
MTSPFDEMLARHVRSVRARSVVLIALLGGIALLTFLALAYPYVSGSSARYSAEKEERSKAFVTKQLASCERDNYTPDAVAKCRKRVEERAADDRRIDGLVATSERSGERTKLVVGLVVAVALGALAWMFVRSLGRSTEALRAMFASPQTIVWIYGVHASVNGVPAAKPIAIVGRGIGEARLFGNPQDRTLSQLRQLVPHAVFGFGPAEAARAQQLLASPVSRA